jgi:hypothetical protein
MNYRNTLVCTVFCRPDHPPGQSLNRLQDSCWHTGMDLTVLGFSGTWNHSYQGKLLQLGQHLQASSYDHILYVDASDVVFVRGLPEIFKQFDAIGSPFLVSAERNVFPFAKHHTPKLIRRPRGRYWAPNTGGMLATRDAFLNGIYTMEKQRQQLGNNPPFTVRNNWSIFTEDQGAITDAYVHKKFPIALDHQCRVFQNLMMVDTDLEKIDNPDLHITPKGLINKQTRTQPCIVHGSGSSRVHVQKIWNQLQPKLKATPPANWRQTNRQIAVPFLLPPDTGVQNVPDER